MEIIGESTVTRKLSRSRIILAALTVLYLPNVIAGAQQWEHINLLIGTIGQSSTEILETLESSPFSSNPVLIDLSGLIPVIVADGLLVRYFCYRFNVV